MNKKLFNKNLTNSVPNSPSKVNEFFSENGNITSLLL